MPVRTCARPSRPSASSAPSPGPSARAASSPRRWHASIATDELHFRPLAASATYHSVGAMDHVVVDGEVYAVLTCPRREIVRAWREVGGGVTALVGALAHPGARLVHV